MLSFYLSLLETPHAQGEFSRTYDIYHQKMYHIANRLLKDSGKAEDAVHDAFVKIILHFDDFLQLAPNKREAWIITILKNTCFDQLRRDKKYIPQDVADLLHLPDPQQNVETDVQARLLQEALQQLSVDDKELLELKLLFHWSDREIAKSLGITANSVAVRVHRVKKRLKQMLEQEGWI